ncbi:MAG TPA: YfhO family protein [Patescibacteria group bacterium]|nr:YfhO family protein [Patescibacteria group bacterium]
MKKELLKPLGIFIFLVAIFFYPIFKGNIPFPGDLLVSTYEPYKAYPILGYQPGGVPSKLQGADVIRHIFPWKFLAIEMIKKGEMPFWYPYNFSGNPLLANFQTGAFYPFNILMLIFPFLTGWTLYIISAPILSAFFMYLLLREFKITKLSSLFGGFAFAFSSFMVIWMEYGNIGHTFLWLPLALLWTHRFLKKFEYRYLFFLSLTLVMSFLAGFVQSFFYLFVAVWVYFLARLFTEKSFNIGRFALFLIATLFPLGLGALQLLPTTELFLDSSRGNYTLSQIQHLLNPWWYMITLVAPNYFGHPASGNYWFYGTYIERVSYIGLVPLILAIYAAFNFRKNKEIIIFGGIALFCLLVTTDLFITKYFHAIPIPVISTAVPTRMLSLWEFGAIILSAFGLDYFRKRQNKKALYFAFGLIFIFLVVGWIFVAVAPKIFGTNLNYLVTTKRNLMLPTVFYFSFLTLSFLWFHRRFKPATFLICLLTFIDLFYFFQKITPFSPKEFVYPKTSVISFLQKNAGINRFWGYGSGYVESNFQIMDKTYSPEGVDPLHLKRYTRLIEVSRKGEFVKELPRPDANILPGYGVDSLKNNIFRQRILDLVGAKYILHKSGDSFPDNLTFPVGAYNFIYHDGHYQIYENKNVVPRIGLFGEYIVEPDREKIILKIGDESGKFNLNKTLILEEKVPLQISPDENAKVEVKNYEENRSSFITSAKTNTLFFLSDNYYEGWTVKVDGRAAKIYRADYTFRAVPLTAGRHEVVFEYNPKSFQLGTEVSGISLLIFAGLSVVFFKKKYV